MLSMFPKSRLLSLEYVCKDLQAAKGSECVGSTAKTGLQLDAYISILFTSILDHLKGSRTMRRKIMRCYQPHFWG